MRKEIAQYLTEKPSILNTNLIVNLLILSLNPSIFLENYCFTVQSKYYPLLIIQAVPKLREKFQFLQSMLIAKML